MKTNNKTGKILFAALTSAALAFGTAAPAFALTAAEAASQDINYARAVENVGNTEYWLELAKDGSGLIAMDVDVPVKVNLAVKANGDFITPSALKNVIENKSEFPVDVTAMALTPKNGFSNVSATNFTGSLTPNIFKGTIASATLAADGNSVTGYKQKIGFQKLGDFSANENWRMEASDETEKKGADCVFVQISGALGNVAGKYFTSPINVFDITYTFAAASADAAIGADMLD